MQKNATAGVLMAAAVLCQSAFGQSNNAAADPFADPTAESNRISKDDSEAPKGFVTSSEIEVEAQAGWSPELIDEDEYPNIPGATDFNPMFEKPEFVWRVEAGYFAAFNAGEWGGGLFFASTTAKRWTRILDSHIQHLDGFSGSRFLAVGGLAHLTMMQGGAYLIWQSNDGTWKTKEVFHSLEGVPKTVGRAKVDRFLDPKVAKMIVIEFDYPIPSGQPIFGIDANGRVTYLGEPK